MTRYLADVSVLLALVWPRHEGHEAAHAWFAKSGSLAWATNPVTQIGLLRLLTNPVVTQAAVGADAAIAALAEFTRHKNHEFWPLDRELPAGLSAFAGRIQGHRQWTGALLLWQVTERDGVLATFDSGLKELAGAAMARRILLLAQGDQRA